MRSSTFLAFGVVGLMTAGLLFAGIFDISGEWDLSLQFTLAPSDGLKGGSDCFYSGATNVVQDGTSVAGEASYQLDVGTDACPSEMTASYTGILTPTTVEMGILSGQLGSADFVGFFSLPSGNSGLGVSGDVTVTSGPFLGATGFWSASRDAPPIDIPTLDAVGLVAMVLLLLCFGVWQFKRH